MQWIKVEQELPPDDEEVLLLIEGFFEGLGDNYTGASTKGLLKIFPGSFNRRFGWNKTFVPAGPCAVVAWMPKPLDPPKET